MQTPETDVVDIAVVGRGMVGSAAARHLALAGHRVALIGPSEPADYATAGGPFSSHFDQGRVTRITSFKEPWGEWAKASIGRYRAVEEQSGISFYDPVGLVVLADHATGLMERSHELGADVEALTVDELRARTGIASNVASHTIIFEGAPAGLINPRRFVEAQTICAAQASAVVVDDAVTGIDTTGGNHTLTCRSGQVVVAERVLLCTGAYGAKLAGVDLPAERRLRTVALADVGEGPDLPTLIIDQPDHPALDEAYWVPPVRFPDGRNLLKIGGDSLPLITARDEHDIDEWFRSGGSEAEATALFELLEALLPDRTIERVRYKPCVVTYPPNSLPYIEEVTPGVTVAFGGSGAAAKSSDEIGRIAGLTALGESAAAPGQVPGMTKPVS